MNHQSAICNLQSDLRHPQCWACWIQRACDVAMAKRGKVWVKEAGDYLSPAEARHAHNILKTFPSL